MSNLSLLEQPHDDDVSAINARRRSNDHETKKMASHVTAAVSSQQTPTRRPL
jgi:hypothetical protein